MSRIDSGLPVRSYQDGTDERVLVKHQDGADPGGVGKTQTIDNFKAYVMGHGKDSDGADVANLLSQEGHTQSNGDYDATNNKRPSSQGLIVSDRDAAPSETTMNKRPTAVAGESNKVAQDVAISHSNGDDITASNPLPMYMAEDPGVEVEDEDLAVNIAKDGSANHDYTVTAATEFRQLNVDCSASGLAWFELQIETGVATGTFVTKNMKFNSTAMPNVSFALKKPVPVAAGVRIRVKKTNLDHQAQDLFSVINGVEV